ncbi:MAG TPA: Dabb family protein [Roseivirga sp.]
MKKFVLLLSLVVFYACESSPQQLPAEDPLVHTAYFWFKEGVTDEQIEAFHKRSEELTKIPEVMALYTGKPADTNRPIVERSYDFAVVVHLKDLAAHDAYQQHPIHQKLLTDYSPLWERVMVTDIEH